MRKLLGADQGQLSFTVPLNATQIITRWSSLSAHGAL